MNGQRRQNALKARFDAIVPTLATKADIEVLRAEMHKVDGRCMIGLFIGFGGLAAALAAIGQARAPARQSVRRRSPRQQQALPAAAGQPIIIYGICQKIKPREGLCF
jgi:hypothetical protein